MSGPNILWEPPADWEGDPYDPGTADVILMAQLFSFPPNYQPGFGKGIELPHILSIPEDEAGGMEGYLHAPASDEIDWSFAPPH